MRREPNNCKYWSCAIRLGVIMSLLAFTSQSNGDETALERGRTLFEKSNWNQRSREFNARSCAVCHHLGGVGGAGEEKFNARSVGIEKLRMPAKTTTARLTSFLSGIHPRFVDPSGRVTTVMPLPHFGGPSQNSVLRTKFSNGFQNPQAASLGPANHQQLLSELSLLPEYVESNETSPLESTVRSFQRNTPALFGLGLIDAVSDEEIRRIAQLQSRQQGISGRPATLSTGGIGRFGWRANVATLVDFNRQACVNELGIRVQPKPEPAPSGAPRPVGISTAPDDMSLQELQALTTFISALPAPQRIVPQDLTSHKQVLRGEQLFAGIGCSICHVPDVGEIEGIYSDLLLHDMGFDLRGASTADPYVQNYRDGISRPTFVTLPPPQGYYGRSVTVPALSPSASGTGQIVSRFDKILEQPYQAPLNRFQFVVLETREQEVVNQARTTFRAGRNVVRQVKFRRNHISPTNVSQEWRTPPLWGLRDSAPYLHDGRAATVREAIMLHAGEGLAIRDQFASLSPENQNAVVAFLKTFVAPADAIQK